MRENVDQNNSEYVHFSSSDGVLIMFQEVVKLRSLEGLDISDVISTNASFSAVHYVLEQELIWFGSLEKSLLFFLVPFLFLCNLRWKLIYDEQKC